MKGEREGNQLGTVALGGSVRVVGGGSVAIGQL